MSILIDRRRFVGTTVAGLALSGCATTTPLATRNSSRCLPPVDVDPSRVIRTVAGLRPYREGGFVIRAEPLGQAKLVHNYGHGGSGITLSWGSARVATNLGLPGHGGPVAVIGSGAIGLTTARLAQEAGYAVTIYTAALPPETTSNIAGGQFYPSSLYKEGAVTPAWQAQYTAAMDYSWRRFQILVGEDYGIRWLPTYNQSTEPLDPLLPNFPPVNRVLRREEQPFPADNMVRYETMYIETGRFLRQLVRDFQLAGGHIVVRNFATPADVAALPERLIFNCTGLGARALFGDTELHPVRGQIAVLLPQPEIDYAYTGDAGYMFPRADGIVLGGTFEHDVWSTTPDPAAISRILARQKKLFAGFRCTR